MRLFLICLCSAGYINAGYEGPMMAPGGISSIYELHTVEIINNLHEKYRCDDFTSCIDALNKITSEKAGVKAYKKMWIERYNEKLTLEIK